MFLAFLAVYAALQCFAEESPLVEIYYINLNSSIDRRLAMESYLDGLGYPYQRINAVDTRYLKYDLSEATASQFCDSKTKPLIIPAHFLHFTSIHIQNLCIRKLNNMKEIGCTLSHLVAMFTLLSSPSKAPYALILEDDMRLALDIDFARFIATFPNDFGIIQMMTSNGRQIEPMLRKYQRRGVQYEERGHRDFWCTGGYLLNKAVIRRELEGILALQKAESGVFRMDLIAGFNRPCAPSSCCEQLTFTHKFPCVLASRGVSADNYIYFIAYGRTYVTTVPLIRGTSLGNVSTIHQTFVQFTNAALVRVEEIIALMKRGRLPLPPYVRDSVVKV